MGHVIPEHLNGNWNFLVYNTKYIHSWIALMVYVCRQRLSLHIEYRLIYSLTKDIIDASICDTSLFNYMADIDVYKIEYEKVNEVLSLFLRFSFRFSSTSGLFWFCTFKWLGYFTLFFVHRMCYMGI